jgi:hypothetical protein
MGLTWNSNSRFAIRNLRLEDGSSELEYGHEVRSAKAGMAGDGGGRAELSINRTTDVNALVTICQDRTPPGSRSPTPLSSRNHCIEPLASIPTRVGRGSRKTLAPNRLRGAKSIRVTTLREIDSEPGFLTSSHLKDQ